MVSVGKPSYQRLRNYEDEELDGETILKREVRKARAWLKFKALSGRRRPRLRIAGLRRFFKKRTTKLVSRVRVSWSKALKRLKDGQSHWNDLFGGNFLFMQGNPAPFGCRTQKMQPHMGYGLQGLPTTYCVRRIA